MFCAEGRGNREVLRLILPPAETDTSILSNVVTIVGNRQRVSYTAHAVQIVNSTLARAGVAVEVLHGADLNLAFPGDPVTSDAKRLEETVAEADAVILATPEYHGTYSAFLGRDQIARAVAQYLCTHRRLGLAGCSFHRSRQGCI